MKPKLACADFTFPLLAHDRALDLIALLEFDAVDIGLFEGRSHLWPSRVFRSLRKSARELAAKLNDRGLKLADVFLQTAVDFVSLAANHPEPKRRRLARDMFVQTLEFAAECGSSHVSALPGVRFTDEPASASWERCCDELSWRLEQAAAVGLTFSVEAHVGSIVPLPRQAMRLVRSVPGLTLTLDYTHFTRRGIADSEVEPLVAHASHFHVRGARKGRLQASFQNNTIDYARVWRVMQSCGYRGYLGIEYVWVDWEHCNEVDNLSETILWRDFLRARVNVAQGDLGYTATIARNGKRYSLTPAALRPSMGLWLDLGIGGSVRGNGAGKSGSRPMLCIRGGTHDVRQPWSRRDFLRVGLSSGCAFGGLASLADLAHAAAAETAGPTAGRRSFGRAKSLVLVYLFGGPSHIDIWDMKPDAPSGIRGEFKPISTSVPGIQITEHLPLLARMADKYAIIRSLSHGDSAHGSASHTMLTGRRPRDLGEVPPREDDYPHYGAVLGKLRPAHVGTAPFVSYPWAIATSTNIVPGQTGGFMGRALDPWRVEPSRRPGQVFDVPLATLPDDVEPRAAGVAT